MIVTFQHPPVNNPFISFDPNNKTHYPVDCKGIYIYGLRLTVDNHRKFVPLYVGTAKNLGYRLFDEHFKQESFPGTGSSLKEIFDFSKSIFTIKDIQDRYLEMLIYDIATNRRRGIQQPLVYYLKFLIWFQNINLFNIKLATNLFDGNSNHKKTIKVGGDLDSIPIAEDLKKSIVSTKQKFNDDYYFVYATFDHIELKGDIDLYKEFKDFINNWQGEFGEENFFKRIELATKTALNQINIHTTAKADGKVYSLTIDFSNIQDCLVNMGGHPFNLNEIYQPNLIIPINR